MKGIGIACMILAVTCAAALRCHMRKRRIRCLRGLCRSLGWMAGEMESRSAGLWELFSTLARQCTGSVAAFYETMQERMSALGEEPFSVLWRAAVDERLGELKEEERDMLSSLGMSLGRYELDRQLEEISRCRMALAEREAEAAREYPDFCRVSIGLACTLCMMLTMLYSWE